MIPCDRFASDNPSCRCATSRIRHLLLTPLPQLVAVCVARFSLSNNNNNNFYYHINTTLLILSVGFTRFPHPPPYASHESLCSNVKAGRSHPSRRFTVEVGTIIIIAHHQAEAPPSASASSSLSGCIISVELEPPTVRSSPEDGLHRVCRCRSRGTVLVGP